MSVAVLVVANDFTALSVAIPAIEGEFQVDLTTAQWVINGYAMVFGVLIVTGGRLADMFGRRNAFFAGAVIFALFSVIGGFAPNVGVLLAARFFMGVGGALMWPAILGMTYGLLPPTRAGLAGGIILGAAGFGNAVGPLIGGALTDSIGWRWIFFLNLPIAAFAMLVTFKVVNNDTPDRTGQRIDYAGVAALSVGVLSLLVALDDGTDAGWTDPYILGLFALGAVAMVVFAIVERRAGSRALVPGDVLGNRQFAAACLATLHDLGDLLLGPSLPAAVHGEAARLFGGRGRRRPPADDGRLRADLVRRRPSLWPPRPQAHHRRRCGLPRHRHVSSLANDAADDVR